LIPVNQVLIPPLHVKIGVMTQIMKQFNKNEKVFAYLCKKFSGLSESKIKAAVYCGPDIRSLMNDKHFPTLLTRNELRAWEAFRDVIDNIFGNFKNPQYKEIVKRLMDSIKKINCRMTVKVHFLDAHIEYFPDNLGQFSEEQGERFHQKLKSFENRYNQSCSANILSDYCWFFVRESKCKLNNVNISCVYKQTNS
jgi:hypothetical protein